jgi:hypothetical protein
MPELGTVRIVLEKVFNAVDFVVWVETWHRRLRGAAWHQQSAQAKAELGGLD